MHQHPGAVYKIPEDVDQFTVIPVLEILPGKIIIFCLRCIGAQYIAQYVFAAGKIHEVFMHPYSPVTAGRNFFTFNIQELIGRHIVGQYKTAVGFQHRRENDAVKYNIILADKMHQLGIFLTPVISPFIGKFFCCTDITDWRIKPNIQHFTLSIR